jgi:hypothetical protein
MRKIALFQVVEQMKIMLMVAVAMVIKCSAWKRGKRKTKSSKQR